MLYHPWPCPHHATHTKPPCSGPSAPIQVPPRPVGPNWLYKRSIYISQEQSAAIQQALIKINVLDGYGNVNYDVRVVGDAAC